MPLAIAALDARVPRRITAAAMAAVLQAVFYWLIARQAIEPAVLQSPTALRVTIFEAARRPRPAAAPRKRPPTGRPRRPTPGREAPSPPVARPIALPPAAAPARASIDWQQAMRREVHSLDFTRRGRKVEFGFPRRREPTQAAPQFGWDYARTHRVQQLPEGGLLINLNDRCAVVLYVLPIPVCRIGHIAVDGGLFDHLRDGRGDRADGLP